MVLGNSIFMMMKRLPCSKGDLSRGRPSPATASAYEHCLKTVLPFFCTKHPMPLPLSCPFSHTLMSSVSATAAFSSDGTSLSACSVHWLAS